MTTALELPKWDVSTVYAGLESPEFKHDFQAIVTSIHDLEARMDELRINP
ncbi:MAG: hypothetical protein ACR2GA_05080 [Chloroflexota bacterium]